MNNRNEKRITIEVIRISGLQLFLQFGGWFVMRCSCASLNCVNWIRSQRRSVSSKMSNSLNSLFLLHKHVTRNAISHPITHFLLSIPPSYSIFNQLYLYFTILWVTLFLNIYDWNVNSLKFYIIKRNIVHNLCIWKNWFWNYIGAKNTPQPDPPLPSTSEPHIEPCYQQILPTQLH